MAGGPFKPSFGFEWDAHLPSTLPVWNGHTCPLPLMLILILLLILRPPRRRRPGRQDREGHDFQSCRKAGSNAEDRHFSAA